MPLSESDWMSGSGGNFADSIEADFDIGSLVVKQPDSSYISIERSWN